MNAAVRAAILRTQSVSSHLKAAFFHSTPVLERKRGTSWDSKSNFHRKRFRRMREKQELLRNVNAFASNMFTSWHDEFDYKEPPSSQKRTSWFKKQYAKEPKGKWNGKHGPRNFDFCEVDEDFDIDYIFPGGPRGFSFSFTFEDDEPPRWHHRDHSSSRSSRSKHHRIYEEDEDDYTTSTESSDSESESEPNQASHRQALGLSPSGPLNLKDVKHAYRVCALKWHPDRHQGSTKEAAEAKFKLCSVAYQSLCEKLGKSNANKKNKRSKKFLREHQEKVRRAVEELKREREEAAAKKAKEAKENLNKCNQDSKSPRKSQFGYKDKDFDIIFRSLFGVPRGFDYSIYEEEDRRWWYHPSWFSGSSSNSWRSKYRFYDKDEEQEEELSEDEESNSSSNWWRSKSRFDEKKKEEEDGYGSSKSNGSVLSDPIEASHRETLGLSPWAPLKIEDVKHAYRTCALKWHPDLHDDSTKAEAEAKFKLCVVAYQSLIQKLQNSWRSNFQFGSVLSDPIEASHRETLGLSPWAPLTLEDVKHAYRACALKWHPDHHDDSTKAEAEAKFKFCNVAYESLIKMLQ
ncbi:unnamed protein product [Brassica napus]|uniref:(rape) hypothetical protein n=1 Tax=Brassica napus TaxID=3708 RepID=A0A816K7P3_BRANA|nr:unnamed protein product [Brassica napus]